MFAGPDIPEQATSRLAEAARQFEPFVSWVHKLRDRVVREAKRWRLHLDGLFIRVDL